jgi:heptosyltransferase-2
MKILIIQTAFIGDVVLATPLVEALKNKFPTSSIDFLVRKGNENLLIGHPKLNEVLIFDKQNGKYKNLFKLIKKVRAEKYDYVINAQRFFTTGLLTALSGANKTIGFNKNPLSFAFSEKVAHEIDVNSKLHEVDRNLVLIKSIVGTVTQTPKLYPSKADYKKVSTDKEYVCLAPSSVWFTKQLPKKKWIELIEKLPEKYQIHLIGGPDDLSLCKNIKEKSKRKNVVISAGKLSFLESVALIENATMNFTNDSGPMHFASAVNAPITAFYCSTIPAFGFGPLSDKSFIAETEMVLDCRPCGLHGKKACPKGHFDCAKVDIDKTLNLVLTS